jgi:hypothetical protein
MIQFIKGVQEMPDIPCDAQRQNGVAERPLAVGPGRDALISHLK